MSKTRDIADSAATINYIDGLTSDAQTQLDGKATLDAQAVASGALANGDLVVINADGTVSVVSETTITANTGSSTLFSTPITSNLSTVFDASSNKVIISYEDTSANRPVAVVGTVSGSSISFGTPVFFSANSGRESEMTYNSFSQKVVIVYRDDGNSNYGTAIVGTVSGDSISFGTPVAYSTTRADNNTISSTLNANTVLIAYRDIGNSSYGTAVVGTISGTSISFGTPVVFNSANSSYLSQAFDSTLNKFAIFYRAGGQVKAIVGTVSGSSVSFGTSVVFNASDSFYVQAIFNSSSNSFVVAYRDLGNSNYGTAIVGTIEENSISFGASAVFESAAVQAISIVFDSSTNNINIAYRDEANSNFCTIVSGEVSGTDITFDTPIVFDNSYLYESSLGFDSESNKVIIGFANFSGRASVFENERIERNLTAENYIGVSDAAYTDGATANIQVSGAVDDAQSGLTAGEAYYVQLDGTLSTTPDNPSVFAGTALSATELLIGKSPAVSLGELGVTATATELNYVSGVTSAIQTQIDGVLPAQTGNAGNFLTTDGTDASWAEVSASPTLEAVASGSLANGDTVIVNSDGTVSVVSGETAGNGSTTVFNAANTSNTSSCFDSNSNKIVIAYRNESNSGAGTAIVGTVSGTSISFGSPVVFASNANKISVAFDSFASKVIIAFADGLNLDYGKAQVGTVSGTSISFVAIQTFKSATVYDIKAAYSVNDNKTVIAFRDSGNSNYGSVVVGTISGGEISFGSTTVFRSATTQPQGVTYVPSQNNLVITFKEGGQGKLIAGYISGTAMSFGSSVLFESGTTNVPSTVYVDSIGKLFIAYQNNTNSGYATYVIASVSGYVVTFLTPVVFNTADSDGFACVYDSNADKVSISYRSSSATFYTLADVSETAATFLSPTLYASNVLGYNYGAFDSNENRVVYSYYDNSNSNYGTSIVFRNKSTNANRYIGISDAAYSDGATAKIQLVGSIDDAQSGLSVGQPYYVQNDGSISNVADSPSVFAGTAVSSTKLIVKG